MSNVYIWIPLLGTLLALVVVFILLKTVVNFTVKKLKVMPPIEPEPEQPTVEKETEEPPIEKFPVKVGDKIIFIDTPNVAYLEAKDNYVYIHDLEGNEYITDYTLKSIEPKTPKDFIRIHRSYIVNTKAIKEIHKYFNGKYACVLRDKPQSKVVSSLSYTEQVKALFRI